MANDYTQLTAVTQDVIIPKLEDNIFDDAPLLKYFMGRPKVQVGGTQLQQPVIKAKDSQGGVYGPGGTFSTDAADTNDKFIHDWGFIEQPIVAFGPHIAMSAGASKMVDHMTDKAQQAMMNLLDKLSTQLYGDGSGAYDWDGLAAMVDDGTNVDNYGGISRATNAWAKAGYTNSVGAIALADLQTAIRGAKSGTKKPQFAVTTEATFDDIEDLMTPTTQNNIAVTTASAGPNFNGNNGLTYRYGGTELIYKGVQIVADEYCTSDKLYVVNPDFMHLTVLKQGATGLKSTEKMGISMTPFQRPDNQDGVVAHLLLYGQFSTSQPRAHYQLDGITN